MNTTKNYRYTNILIHEDSPYLQQHAHNPVDWMPWCDAAFEKARNENKLIFLSIGYSTCHWCHVMEHESFENETAAALMNEKYVSIKVDREEMPHVDKYYQDMHYLLQQRPGGWPLSIVMLPDRRVVFAATYLPLESRNNMMGFKQLLTFLDHKHRTEPDEMDKSAQSIVSAFERYQNHRQMPVSLSLEVIQTFITNVKKSFDEENKGIGDSPKFPHASSLDVLLDVYAISKNIDALKMSDETHKAMACGGIYDQIEGGFYRYSVDAMWQVPHFEKMLYTNAELLESYSKLFRITHNPLYKETVEGIVHAMNERFLHEGLYFSASDADSEGEEGKYFVFIYDQALEALVDKGLSTREALDILAYYNITKEGNFEHHATNPYVTTKPCPVHLEMAKKVLKDLRARVHYPFIDTKVLTSWNALFIRGLLEAGEKVDSKYTVMALDTLERLLDTVHVNGVLYHQYLFGSTLKSEGLLEDFAYMSDALLKAYEVSGVKRYLELAEKFIIEAKERFYRHGNWYLNAGTFEAKAPLEDASYRSAMARMMGAMATFALYDFNPLMMEDVRKMLMLYSGNINQYPHAYPEALRVWLKVHKGEVLLKVPTAQMEAALRAKEVLGYPYLYVIESHDNQIQACMAEHCFAYGTVLEDVMESIKERVV